MVKKVQYDQNQVNKSLEKTFDMGSTTDWQDLPAGGPVDHSLVPANEPIQMINNQILQIKKKGRGGARANSGRKVGSTVKLSAADLLTEISRIDKPFAEGLAEDYKRAREEGDLHIVQRYQQMFLSKVIADKQELDVTSNGQTMGASFTFPTLELPDWSNEPIKH